MSEANQSDCDAMPPLLRREVFDNPGGVDWLRTQSVMPRKASLTATALCILLSLFLGIGAFSVHEQNITLGYVDAKLATNCGIRAPACIAFRWADGIDDRLAPGMGVRLETSSGTVVRLPTSAADGLIALNTSLRVTPATNVVLIATKRSSLLGWIFRRQTVGTRGHA